MESVCLTIKKIHVFQSDDNHKQLFIEQFTNKWVSF